ncbi:hypothetical protein ACWGJ0_34755 [Streptomyces massasporeus]
MPDVVGKSTGERKLNLPDFRSRRDLQDNEAQGISPGARVKLRPKSRPAVVSANVELNCLGEYLLAICSGGRVERLGRHRAVDATGRPTDRARFAVIREQPR